MSERGLATPVATDLGEIRHVDRVASRERAHLRPDWLGMCGVWAILVGALVWQAYHTGITVDEPSHLVSSSLYWKGNDILLPRDMPPLIKIATGTMQATRDVPILYEKPAWKERSEWQMALELMLNLPKPEIQPLFFHARLPMILFPLLSTLILFLWGRALFGPLAGLAAAFLFAFEPTSLGHGALVKNDHAATFGYLFFWYRAWRYWKNPGRGELSLLALGTGLAVMAKLSLLIVLLIAPVLIVIRSGFGERPRWRQAILHAMLPVVGVYALMLATSWFDIRRLEPWDFDKLALYTTMPWWIPVVAKPFQILPLPMLYWDGIISLLNSQGDGSPVYLAGKVFERGTPWYFAVAFALKSPVALQILLAGGLVATGIALWRKRLKIPDAGFLIVPAVLYVVSASMVSMQLGFRLILPALPFASLLCVSIFLFCRDWRRAVPVVALVVAVGFASARNFDTLIGYFNPWAGERLWASYYLADSNLDWGQDLPALNRWYRATRPGKVGLFYFGMDNCDRFFTESEVQRMPTPWTMSLIKSKRFQPEPGYYAVSVNQLRGQFFSPEYRDYLACFRSMTPVHYAGASIFVYKVP
jgi:hypothetical protein